MPADSATVAAVTGQPRGWTDLHELSAVTADRVGEMVWLTAELNRDSSRYPSPFPPPQRIRRPGEKADGNGNGRRRHMTVGEMKQLVAGASSMVKGGDRRGV